MVRHRRNSTSSETSTDSWSIVEDQTVVSSVSLDSDDDDERNLENDDVTEDEHTDEEQYESDLEIEETRDFESDVENDDVIESQEQNDSDREVTDIEEEDNMCLIQEEEALQESQALRFVATSKIVSRLDQLATHYDSLYERLCLAHPRPVFILTISLSVLSALTVAQLIQYTCLSSSSSHSNESPLFTGLQTRWGESAEWQIDSLRAAAQQCKLDFLLEPCGIPNKKEDWPLPNMSMDAPQQVQVQIEQHTFEEFEKLKNFYVIQLKNKKAKSWSKEAPTSPVQSKLFKNISNMCHYAQNPSLGLKPVLPIYQPCRKHKSLSPCYPKIFKPTIIKNNYPQTPCEVGQSGPIPPPQTLKHFNKLRRESKKIRSAIEVPEFGNRQLTVHRQTKNKNNSRQCPHYKSTNDVEKLLKLTRQYGDSRKASQLMRKSSNRRREYCTREDIRKFKPTHPKRAQLAQKKSLPCVPMKNHTSKSTKNSVFSVIERKPTLPAKILSPEKFIGPIPPRTRAVKKNDWLTERAKGREKNRRIDQEENWLVERAQTRADARKNDESRVHKTRKDDWFTTRSRARAQARAN
ncbi:hypothetical protein WR25_07710 [Diploscapter pachys]|uniref:Uncharacterized protein n=1 Tax=Diploscapter pachys TaxID=2018661 RepID=A0A2A2L1N1_9BILA|nr:hypothetical protein WR25_07710 [Diploscapter pachys]